jgi:ribonuclease HI
MPFTKIPPSLPPRGSRRDWREQLALPNRLDLYGHGLVERRLATYGFVVWDVGENRMIMEHGRLIAEGAQATQALADHRALIEGIGWLVRQELHRRRITAYTDSALVYGHLMGEGPVSDEENLPLVWEARRAVDQCLQLTLKLISPHENSRAVQLAANAYVKAQEARRKERAAEVIPELSLAQPGVYMVGDRYRVDLAAGTCTCPDYRQMHTQQYPIRCKHLLAAISLEMGADR